MSFRSLAEYAEYTPAAYTLTADKGTFTRTGIAARLLFNRRLVAAKGSFLLAGRPIFRVYIMSAGRGTFTLLGGIALYRLESVSDRAVVVSRESRTINLAAPVLTMVAYEARVIAVSAVGRSVDVVDFPDVSITPEVRTIRPTQ